MPPERPDKKKLSEQSVEACRRALDALGQQLLEGEISISDFEASFKSEMKAEYIRQYLFGIGGLANMTAEDWATVAKDLEAQYKYADDYIDELEDAANEDDDGLALIALLWRLGLYAVSAGAVYELANELFHEAEGYTEERWNLDDGIDDHCQTCPEYASRGWVPIGEFPEPGDGHTECKNNCHCWKTYRKEDGTESE
jgi:hypothetical protein